MYGPNRINFQNLFISIDIVEVDPYGPSEHSCAFLQSLEYGKGTRFSMLFCSHIKSSQGTTTSRNEFQTHFRFYIFLEAWPNDRTPNTVQVHHFLVFWLRQNFPDIPPPFPFRHFWVASRPLHDIVHCSCSKSAVVYRRA